MKRTALGIFIIFLILSFEGTLQAQIKIVKKPAPALGPDDYVIYSWTSSWGTKSDAPDKYPLGFTVHKTEDEAVIAAKAHMARTAGNGIDAVTHYLIEGEPKVRNKMADRIDKAKAISTRLREAKAAVDAANKDQKGEPSQRVAKERTLGDTIKEYKEMVAQSFRQAVDAKTIVTDGVAGLTDAKTRRVNGLIDEYNRELQDFDSIMDSKSGLGFSPMARISVKVGENEPGIVDISGTKWTDAWGTIYEFKKGGVIEVMRRKEKEVLPGKWKWKQIGNKLTIESTIGFKHGEYHEMTLVGKDRMSGRSWTKDTDGGLHEIPGNHEFHLHSAGR